MSYTSPQNTDPSSNYPYSYGQRPGVPRTTSSNYAQAQALQAAKKYASTSSTGTTSSSSSTSSALPIRSSTQGSVEDSRTWGNGQSKDEGVDLTNLGEGRRVVGDVSAGAGWTPRYVNVQSWNEQDMKREFQMARLAENTGAGFSEAE